MVPRPQIEVVLHRLIESANELVKGRRDILSYIQNPLSIGLRQGSVADFLGCLDVNDVREPLKLVVVECS